jgi:5-(hydroxymethyl)furfural/furfural oxidase
VLPYFKKLENDLDFSGPLHGAQGPIDVSRVPVTVWPGFTQAAANAFTQAGYTNIEDQNGRFEDGWFPAALSASRQQRRSAAMGYLDLATRSRPNLSIRTGTHVHQLQREGLRIVGVSVDGKAERAHRVILSAGALQSPAFLLRTGIGPEQQLRDLGIDVVADRQGVGANLQEHPSIAMSAWIRPHARLGEVPRRHVQMALRYTSDIPGSPPSDMYTVVVSKSAWHPIGRRLGSLFTWINKPYSKGSLKLISADPGTYPEVAFELLSDPRDLARMKAAMVKMWMHFQSASLRSAASDPFAATHGAMAAAVGKTTLRNWLMTIGPALLMDGPAALRQLVIRRLLAPGSDFAKAIADDDALTAIVRHHTIGGWHASGTCRMGSADDAHAVVSPHDGSVHGVEGLHVIDASVMPCVPRANTNFPTIMIAEKMAAQLLVRAQP